MLPKYSHRTRYFLGNLILRINQTYFRPGRKLASLGLLMKEGIFSCSICAPFMSYVGGWNWYNGSMKKIAVFDLDGTVYTHTLTFDVVEELLQDSKFSEERKSVELAKHEWRKREATESYWVYNKKVLDVFERITPQVTPQQMKIAIENVLSRKGKYCYVYTTSLIDALKKEGRLMIAISGSIKNIVEPFALALGFDIIVSSELEVIDGVFTGKRSSQTNTNKDQLLRDVVEKNNATLEDSVGAGDTHRDISMLSLLQNPIAFNPNSALYDEAVKKGWKIVIERKNMIYEMVKKADGYVLENAHPSRGEEHQEHLR